MVNFNDIFSDAPRFAAVPSIPIKGAKFRLLKIEPYHAWVMTGEVKADGTPKWAQDPELVTDETGETLRCVVHLQIITDNGLQTSPQSPFEDNKHYFSEKELKALVKAVGKEVVLENPRIDFKEVSGENSKGFKRVETRMQFAYDSIKA